MSAPTGVYKPVWKNFMCTVELGKKFFISTDVVKVVGAYAIERSFVTESVTGTLNISEKQQISAIFRSEYL